MLRIIAGQLRGQTLHQPQTSLTRPTTDKVKEALFSIVHSLFLKHDLKWQDQTAVDFFAGSGSLIFETLSRGTSYGLGIDHGQEALKTMAQNKAKLKLSDSMDILSLDVTHLPRATREFSMIFLDPPYSFKNLDYLLNNIITQGWCAPQAWIIFELSIEAPTPDNDFINVKIERTYGKIKIVIARLR